MNNRFEIDSKCPDSDMVNKVKEEIKKNKITVQAEYALMGLSLGVHRILQQIFVLDIR